MYLDDGTYQILSPLKTDRGHLRVAQDAPEETQVNDSDNRNVFIKHISGDNYTIQYAKYHEDFIGPSDSITEGGTLKFRPEAFEWVIDNIGPGQFKVHAPNQELYWQLPDNAGSQTKIILDKAKGKAGEIWIFRWANREF